MNTEQIELLIELISVEAQIAGHPQNPPRSLFDRREVLRDELRKSVEAANEAMGG